MQNNILDSMGKIFDPLLKSILISQAKFWKPSKRVKMVAQNLFNSFSNIGELSFKFINELQVFYDILNYSTDISYIPSSRKKILDILKDLKNKKKCVDNSVETIYPQLETYRKELYAGINTFDYTKGNVFLTPKLILESNLLDEERILSYMKSKQQHRRKNSNMISEEIKYLSTQIKRILVIAEKDYYFFEKNLHKLREFIEKMSYGKDAR